MCEKSRGGKEVVVEDHEENIGSETFWGSLRGEEGKSGCVWII